METPREWKQASMLIDELKICGKNKDLARGKRLHQTAVHSRAHKNKYVATALISMYSKCGSMQDAQQVFKTIFHPNLVTWTALISGYADNGNSSSALDMFDRMDVLPNAVTFIAVLKACATLAKTNKASSLQRGQALHERARQCGCDKDLFVASTLVDMYSKAGGMSRARAVFEKMSEHDVVSWSALILGYVENGQSEVALEMFARIDCSPNAVTLAGAIKACAILANERKVKKKACLETGMALHKQAKDIGVENDVMVANMLVDMYSKCGEMIRAKEVFNGMVTRTVISWNALMFGYLESGRYQLALDVFHAKRTIPNSASFVGALKATAALAVSKRLDKSVCLQNGANVHRQAVQNGFEEDVFVASSLVDMYCKCGDMKSAREVFNRMKHRDAVSWSVLICGYVDTGESSMALEVFQSMDCPPDKVIYLTVLKACASLGALSCGQRVHRQICMLGLESSDETLENCLVDFYSKCGKVSSAEEVFNGISSPKVVTWSALIGGYCLLGDTVRVFRLVETMLAAQLTLDSVTVLLVLTACSHAGFVVEARRCFESLAAYGVVPSLEHYTCMINILCRAKRLNEALGLLKSMPFVANSPVWMILLVACEKWNNLEMAKVAFNALVCENDEDHVPTAYVLMRNIYQRLGSRNNHFSSSKQ